TRDYANLAKSMPAMVMTSGLMPTFAFLEGKGEVEHRTLLAHALFWLSRRRMLNEGLLGQEGEYWRAIAVVSSKHANKDEKQRAERYLSQVFRQAMEQLRAMNARQYQRATEETLAILKWIRHFADAVKGE
ncbi:type III-B CRISPR module-associated protein Cmr5, partial [Candidatus Parcubacteria bacterium]